MKTFPSTPLSNEQNGQTEITQKQRVAIDLEVDPTYTSEAYTNVYTLPTICGFLKDPIRLTPHAQKRMAQRGITEQMIADTIEYGQCVRKQQISYYIMLTKCIPDGLPPSYTGRLKNCIVLVNWLGEVMTVYRNDKGLKAIAKKTDYRCGRLIERNNLPEYESLQKQAASHNETISIEELIVEPNQLHFGVLAEERLHEYNLSLEDIVLALKHGRRRRASKGCLHVILNGCGALLNYPINVRQRLNGLQLVITPCGKVIKLKYSYQPRYKDSDLLEILPHLIAA